MPPTVRCQRCGDAGFVKRDDLDVSHPHFGQAFPCPACEGARKARNPKEEYRWFLEREHAQTPLLPADPHGPLRPVVEKLSSHLLRPDEEGAHSRWTPPMVVKR